MKHFIAIILFFISLLPAVAKSEFTKLDHVGNWTAYVDYDNDTGKLECSMSTFTTRGFLNLATDNGDYLHLSGIIDGIGIGDGDDVIDMVIWIDSKKWELENIIQTPVDEGVHWYAAFYKDDVAKNLLRDLYHGSVFRINIVNGKDIRFSLNGSASIMNTMADCLDKLKSGDPA